MGVRRVVRAAPLASTCVLILSARGIGMLLYTFKAFPLSPVTS